MMLPQRSWISSNKELRANLSLTASASRQYWYELHEDSGLALDVLRFMKDSVFLWLSVTAMVLRFLINSLNAVRGTDFNRVRSRVSRYHRKNSTELICGHHRETP